jgi:hypothetical protein
LFPEKTIRPVDRELAASEGANYTDDLSAWARVPSSRIPPASSIQKKMQSGRAIVLAATYTQDPKVLLEVSEVLWCHKWTRRRRAR